MLQFVSTRMVVLPKNVLSELDQELMVDDGSAAKSRDSRLTTISNN